MGEPRKQGNQLRDFHSSSVRSGWKGEPWRNSQWKWLDVGFIAKLGLTKFAEGLDVVREREGVKNGIKDFGLNN